MIMINKLKNTYDILNRLDDQNSKKFISADLEHINNVLDFDLKEYISFQKEDNSYNLTEDEKKLISNIMFKIEELETKISPKANLFKSFSNSIS